MQATKTQSLPDCIDDKELGVFQDRNGDIVIGITNFSHSVNQERSVLAAFLLPIMGGGRSLETFLALGKLIEAIYQDKQNSFPKKIKNLKSCSAKRRFDGKVGIDNFFTLEIKENAIVTVTIEGTTDPTKSSVSGKITLDLSSYPNSLNAFENIEKAISKDNRTSPF